MNILYLGIFYLFSSEVSCSLTSDYYENLIQQKIRETETYVLRQNNEEFREVLKQENSIELKPCDFVIIGAGAAGSVLATRLSEIDDFSVVLIEAGGEENDFNKIPAIWIYNQFSELNWGYLSTPQQNCCLGMKNNQCMIPRGKVVSGSTGINGAIYSRGNSRDYDYWAALGNTGWGYKDVFPYFMKSENSQIDGDLGYHCKGGLWNVEYAKPTSPLFSNFIEGNLELNQTAVDYNGRNQVGSAEMQFNTKGGVRQSTGTAFLDYARKRRNLQVITGALATKIIIEPDTKIAIGVEFVTKTGKYTIRANKEVICSAGAINSPQLLMLSGIGPKKHLQKMGIKVIKKLPVGKNLLEHPMLVGLTLQTNYTLPSADLTELVKLYVNGLGPLTKPTGANGLGFLQTGRTPFGQPTFQYVIQPPTGDASTIISKILNFNDDITNNFMNKINPISDTSIYLILLHEKSRGRITLNSSNPLDFPKIDLNMFSKQDDIDTMIEGIEFIYKLAETEAFRRINATFLPIPICSEITEYRPHWECIIRKMTSTAYHPCGTTRMGNNEKTSVVDNNLNVHGIRHLKVVDAGVFPTTISGNTAAPTVMIAEKIADFIKKSYGYN